MAPPVRMRRKPPCLSRASALGLLLLCLPAYGKGDKKSVVINERGDIEAHGDSMKKPMVRHADGALFATKAVRYGNRASSASIRAGSSTSQLVETYRKLAGRVIAGEEKITDAFRAALDAIIVEMDNIIAHAEQNQKELQGTVDSEKLSIEGCGSAVTTSHEQQGGLDDLALAVTSTREAHSTCRSAEKTLKEDETTKCGSYAEFQDNLMLPVCACPPAEITEQCVEALTTWSAQANFTWKSKKSACNSATSLHSTKQASCNTLQAQFESSFCVWASGLNLVCTNQETCRSTQIDLRNKSHAAVAVSESGLKNEYESAIHVKCFLRVLNATDAGAKEGMFNNCLNATVDSSNLSITYHSIPSPATCDITPVATKPCDAAWQNAEFQKDWITTTCVPCFTLSTPTTTTTTISTEANEMVLMQSPLSDFTAAESWCVAKGGHLVSIHSEEQMEEVKKWLRETKPTSHPFVGAQRQPGDTTWHWIDGTPYDYQYTAYGDLPYYNCMYVIREGSHHIGYWGSDGCSGPRFGICSVPTTTAAGYTIHDGDSCRGVIVGGTGTGHAECLALCNAEPQCWAYEINKVSGYCYLRGEGSVMQCNQANYQCNFKPGKTPALPSIGNC